MNNMLLALQITALGMGLVFAAIVLLWWMMSLLTYFTAEKEDSTSLSENTSDAVSADVMDNDLRAQAAAVAVAIALAEQEVSPVRPFPMTPAAIVSAWQLGMRTRQLSQKGIPLSRTPRKIG